MLIIKYTKFYSISAVSVLLKEQQPLFIVFSRRTFIFEKCALNILYIAENTEAVLENDE